MRFLLLFLLMSSIFGSPTNPDEGDYDFDEVVGLSLNDTVLVFSDKADEEEPFEGAAVTIMLAEMEQLRTIVGEKEEEVQRLHSQIVLLEESNEKEKLVLEQKHEEEKIALAEEWEAKVNKVERKASLEEAKYKKLLSNKNILTRFLSFRLRNNEKKARISRDVIEAQNEKLSILGIERKTYQEKNKVNLKQVHLQAESILKLEAQKTELKDALRQEAKLQRQYCNLTELVKNDLVGNCHSYATMMTKSLLDQSEEMDKLRWVLLFSSCSWTKLIKLTCQVIFGQ